MMLCIVTHTSHYKIINFNIDVSFKSRLKYFFLVNFLWYPEKLLMEKHVGIVFKFCF